MILCSRQNFSPAALDPEAKVGPVQEWSVSAKVAPWTAPSRSVVMMDEARICWDQWLTLSWWWPYVNGGTARDAHSSIEMHGHPPLVPPCAAELPMQQGTGKSLQVPLECMVGASRRKDACPWDRPFCRAAIDKMPKIHIDILHPESHGPLERYVKLSWRCNSQKGLLNSMDNHCGHTT